MNQVTYLLDTLTSRIILSSEVNMIGLLVIILFIYFFIKFGNWCSKTHTRL
jgi:hypothetical protein